MARRGLSIGILGAALLYWCIAVFALLFGDRMTFAVFAGATMGALHPFLISFGYDQIPKG